MGAYAMIPPPPPGFVLDDAPTPVIDPGPGPGARSTAPPQYMVDQTLAPPDNPPPPPPGFTLDGPQEAVDPDLAEALQGTAQAKLALGALLQPLGEDWRTPTELGEPKSFEEMLAQGPHQVKDPTVTDLKDQRLMGLAGSSNQNTPGSQIPMRDAGEVAGNVHEALSQGIPQEYIRAITDTMPQGMVANLLAKIPGVGDNIEGIRTGAESAVGGMISPYNAMITAGTAGLGTAGELGLAGVFEAQALIHAPEQLRQLRSETDPKKRAALATEMAVGLGLPALAGAKFATKKLGAKLEAAHSEILEAKYGNRPNIDASAPAPAEPATGEAIDAPELFTPTKREPIFAQGDTVHQRTDNFLNPEDGAEIPTAVRFAKGEEVPAALTEEPSFGKTELPNGETIVYDRAHHDEAQLSEPGQPSAPVTSAPNEGAIADPLSPESPLPKTDVVAPVDVAQAEVNSGQDGFHVVIAPDEPGEGPLSTGPWETRQEAQDFIDSEVGAHPDRVRIAEVRNGKPVNNPFLDPTPRPPEAPAPAVIEPPRAPRIEPPKQEPITQEVTNGSELDTRMRLRSREAASTPLFHDIPSHIVDAGKAVFRQGMKFAEWAGEMTRKLGDAVLPHLKRIWDHITSGGEAGTFMEGGGINLKGERTDTVEATAAKLREQEAPPVTEPAKPMHVIEAAKELAQKHEIAKTGAEEEFFGRIWPDLLKSTRRQTDYTKPGSIRESARRAVADTSTFLKDNPKFADYYAQDWKATLGEMESHFGRKLTPDEEAFFRLSMGLTSPNTMLPSNVGDAIGFTDHFVKHGNLDDVVMGKSALGNRVLVKSPFSISGNTNGLKAFMMKQVLELNKRRGEGITGTVKHLEEMVPTRELQAFNKEMGYKGSVGKIGAIRKLVKEATGQDELIPRMFVFGPKVGAYTLNSLGDSRYTTVDLWESRFIRSYFKGMFDKQNGLPANVDEHVLFNRFSKLFEEEFNRGKEEKLPPSALQAVRWFYIIDAAKKSGYTRASTNETISHYTRESLARTSSRRGAEGNAPSLTGDEAGQALQEGVDPGQAASGPLKLRSGEAGSTTLFHDIPAHLVEGAKAVYRKGMEFAEWAGEMTKRFGAAAGKHLNELWRSLTGASTLPGKGEGGAIFSRGGTRKRAVGQRGSAIGDLVMNADAKKSVAQRKNAVDNESLVDAHQLANRVRGEFGGTKAARDVKGKKGTTKQDLDSISAVIESGRNKAEVAKAVDLVRTSKDKKLAKKWTPVFQYALDHFDRLNAIKTTHDQIHARQQRIEIAHNITSKQHANYVTHFLNKHADDMALEPAMIGGAPGRTGMSRYFTKRRSFATLAEAIHEGFDPKSTNIADLMERRLNTGMRLVKQKQMMTEMEKSKAADGRPIIGELDSVQRPGSKSIDRNVPAGYDTVNANGTALVVHKQFAPLFRALYGDSRIRDNAAGRIVLKVVAVQKAYSLAADTYHAGRMTVKGAIAGKGTGRFGYNRGLALAEFTDKDMAAAVKRGDVTQREANYAKKHRAEFNELLRGGINIGRFADNLQEQAGVHFPGTLRLNNWIFGKLSRGAMVQASLANFKRNLSRFPELGREGNARRTATEMNEFFGNLNSESILKDKMLQDVSRVLFLAPQWVESQLRTEGRGYAQMAKVPIDALRGKFRVGVIAQAQATGVLAFLVGNQVLNYATTGHSTFQNEEGHKLDAYIPIGKFGQWWSPFSTVAEFAHQAHKYAGRYENATDIATQIAANKLSPAARSLYSYGTGRDYAGRPYANQTDRFRGAATDLIPTPFAASSIIEKDPRQTIGYRWNRQSGSIIKQGLQAGGVKPDAGQSPRSKMFAIAKPFRDDKQRVDISEYGELKKALAEGDKSSVKAEVALLLSRMKDQDEESKADKLDLIKKNLGVSTDKYGTNSIKKERFTDSKEHEQEMIAAMTPAQEAIYEKALEDHAEAARLWLDMLGDIKEEMLAK